MSQRICPGDGSCLEQIDLKSRYKKYDDFLCSYRCEPVKCPNYEVCGYLEPQYILWCYNGTCPGCRDLFGHLQFSGEKECPICTEPKPSVKGLHCDHSICIDCFKRCHLPPYWNDPQPTFPYSSEIEDEYYSNQEDLRWRNDPLIQKYEADWRRWEEERYHREEQESYLKKCPMCRQ